VHERCALLVEHAQVTHKRIEAPAVAGRGDDHLRLDADVTGEKHVGPVEPLDGADDLDPAGLYRVDEAVVEGR